MKRILKCHTFLVQKTEKPDLGIEIEGWGDKALVCPYFLDLNEVTSIRPYVDKEGNILNTDCMITLRGTSAFEEFRVDVGAHDLAALVWGDEGVKIIELQ